MVISYHGYVELGEIKVTPCALILFVLGKIADSVTLLEGDVLFCFLRCKKCAFFLGRVMNSFLRCKKVA